MVAGVAAGVLFAVALREVAGPLVHLFFGPDFEPAVPLMRRLSLVLPGAFAMMVVGTVFAAWRRQLLAMWILAAAFGVSLTLNLVWIPGLGSHGVCQRRGRFILDSRSSDGGFTVYCGRTPAGDIVNTPLAGVVIVHFGEVDPTIGCTASVCGDPSRLGRRVIVVDNSGNLETDALGSGVEVIRRPDNPGFGAAINVGVAALEGDEGISFYVVLNNDAVLGPGYLDAAADALEVGVGAAGGPIRDGLDTSKLWYAGGGINFLTGTVRQQRYADTSGQGRDVGYIPATAMAVSSTAWRDVGGFDERFFLYNEDLDLCLRLRRAGWRLRFEPGWKVFTVSADRRDRRNDRRCISRTSPQRGFCRFSRGLTGRISVACTRCTTRCGCSGSVCDTPPGAFRTSRPSPAVMSGR